MLNKIKKYALIFLPLLVGIVASLLVDFNIYKEINKPPLAPPALLFPIVWSILYLLMGISLFLITGERDEKENKILFGIQLFLNFIWVIIFFRFKLFLISFIVIILLDFSVLYIILTYYRYNKVSSYLLIPYFLWIAFASYLNWSIFLLN